MAGTQSANAPMTADPPATIANPTTGGEAPPLQMVAEQKVRELMEQLAAVTQQLLEVKDEVKQLKEQQPLLEKQAARKSTESTHCADVLAGRQTDESVDGDNSSANTSGQEPNAEDKEKKELNKQLENLKQELEEVKKVAEEDRKETGMKEMRGFTVKHGIRPEPWDGENEREFPLWLELFTGHMMTCDPTWQQILDGMQEHARRTPDMFADDKVLDEVIKKANIKTENGSLLRTEMKHTLFSSLLTYVKGEARAEVIGLRVGAVFEAYCQLYKKGVKANEVNILRKRVSAMAPQKATKISEVKEKVRAWKSDLTYLKEMDGQYQMQEADKAAILFSILPPDLIRDLVKKVPDRRKFHEVEKELESVLQALEELDPRQSKSIGKLQLVVTEGEKEEESQEKPGACHHEHAGDDGAFYDEWYGQYIAFVKRSAEDNDEENPAKRQKGKGHEVGKGKGKSKGAEDRKCYNCGESGHLARNFPRQYVPPKTVWGSWWPGKGYSKGGKGGNGGKG